MKKQNSCLKISISREGLNSFDDSSFTYDFQSFSIDFPSQIWLYIISQKKTRKYSAKVEERVLNVSGKLYTNVLTHTTRKNNILIILSLNWREKKRRFYQSSDFPIFRPLKCAFPISAFFRPIPCDIPDTDKNVKKSCLCK